MMAPAATASPPMPVIVGAPRSGTTLLRLMLDAHPQMAIPPETGFLTLGQALGEGPDPRRRFLELVMGHPPEAPAWPDFGIDSDDFATALAALEPFSTADACRTFYRLYAARFGKPRWGDKTPLYGLHLPEVTGLLPEAHVVHLIRDGRDVALSLRQTWFSPGREIEVLAEYWQEVTRTTRDHGQRYGRYLEVRFEDLVTTTEEVLRLLCVFLALPYDARMMDYYHDAPGRLAEHRARVRPDGSVVISHEGRIRQQALTMHPPQMSRVQAWREVMTADERRRFEHVAGNLLAALGYES
jgi:hypothetical protein